MLIPIQDRIVVISNPPEEKTKSGLFIPDASQEKTNKGLVLAVGKSKPDEIMEIEVHDEIIYDKYAGQEIKMNGETFVILKQSDIFVITHRKSNSNSTSNWSDQRVDELFKIIKN